MKREELYQRDKRTTGVKLKVLKLWNFYLHNTQTQSSCCSINRKQVRAKQDVKGSGRQADPGSLRACSFRNLSLTFHSYNFLACFLLHRWIVMRSNLIYHLLEILKASICEPLACISELTFISNHNRLKPLFKKKCWSTMSSVPLGSFENHLKTEQEQF